ncbi:LANO_0D01442g1_1 [Lachancea nothofagi CBS 11611]|uniref:LANO_0D01442g1_1 n=1 Tax=Lachancea nothofagi CBS 11611 TaxID=1266666 RepID=A0A1G4JE57_9SACH|nr:LANO_0D01442g1_1 [Lachancea nothofagi CBS 11611]
MRMDRKDTGGTIHENSRVATTSRWPQQLRLCSGRNVSPKCATTTCIFRKTLAKAKDEFDKELGKRFGDILAVTDAVDELLGQARAVDASLMDLCFNDSVCKLEAVPEPGASSSLQSTSRASNGGHLDPAFVSNVHRTLAVSEWALAVRSFTEDPSAAKNFDALLASFESIQQINGKADQYQSVVSDKCRLVEAAVLDGSAPFTAVQWVKLYHLFHSDTDVFAFQQLEALDKLAFDFLLRNEDLLQCSQTEPEVQRFLNSPAFKNKSNERLLQDVELQFSNYQRSHETVSRPPISLYDLNVEQSLSTFVQDIDFYCNGIIEDQDRKLDVLVETVAALVRKLKSCGADLERIQDIKKRLINCLEARRESLLRECEAKAPERDLSRAEGREEFAKSSSTAARIKDVEPTEIAAGQPPEAQGEPTKEVSEEDQAEAEGAAPETTQTAAPETQDVSETTQAAAPETQDVAETQSSSTKVSESDRQAHANDSTISPVANCVGETHSASSRSIVSAAISAMNSKNLMCHLEVHMKQIQVL